MIDIRFKVYLLSTAMVITIIIVFLSSIFFAHHDQSEQVYENTDSLTLLLEYQMTATLALLPINNFNPSWEEQVQRAGSFLQLFIDQLTEQFHGYSIGYYDAALQSIVAYGPNLPAADLPDFAAKSLMNERLNSSVWSVHHIRTRTTAGNMLATTRPIIQEDHIVGYIWAYSITKDNMLSYLNYIRDHIYALFLPPLLILLGVSLICLLYSRKHYETYQKTQQTLKNKVIEAQEEERKRVSRELHDSIGQALYSIFVGLKILKNLKMESSIHYHLLEMEKMTDVAMTEVKRMAMELRPSALDDLGLVPAIRSYLETYERTFGISTSFVLTGKHVRYSQKIETALYRITQEALTNAAKYAEAGQVKVQVVNKPNVLNLIIEDDGKGFQIGDESKSSGLGLNDMRERAESVGGMISIQSEINTGTCIEVQVKLHGYPVT